MTVLAPPYCAEVYRVKPKDFSPEVEVAACYIRHEGRYLLLHRAEGKPQQHTWGVPAGKVEKGESPLAAVLREVREETGILLDKQRLKKVAPLFVRYPHIDFIFHMFTEELLEIPLLHLSDEHQGHCWATTEEIFSLPLISGGREVLHHFLALEGQCRVPRKGFYFVRHGETDVNADPHIKRVDYDLPLNRRGREQAHAAKYLVDSLSFTRVICSPIQRAQQTKEIMLAGFEGEECDDERISECAAEIWTKMVKLEEGRGFDLSPAVQAFLSRVIDGIASALEDDELPLFVAHGGVHWAICYHLAIENHPWKIGNCEIVHFSPFGDDEWKATILS